MLFSPPYIFVLLAGIFVNVLVHGLSPTDEYRDADLQQTGYLSNHNMDPGIIDSSSFGQLWKVAFNFQEQFYAKPLTYTPLTGGPQLLFLASSQNYIRTLNAETGVLINSRQVHTPFLQSDIGCTDIPNFIGIIGTPIIDPATDIAYFFAKTYIPNYRVPGNTGTANGVYYFHAVNISTLLDVFPPILIDGAVADNAPQKYFIGGVILQRPSLTQVGSVVYGSFGGHCDLFNYTGLVMGIDINKAKIITNWAVESGPLVAQTNDLLQGGGGGEGGIWMSGMGLATDGARIFLVTGNGGAHQNQGTPASGSSGCQTLGEATINLALDNTGVISVSDYFQPYDYQNMDAGDQDFGSGGIVLLDPTVFKGTGVDKMAVTAGKNGKIYILNANNLGGYKLGPGQTDNILQTIVTNAAVFGACGSYPLEGGFIYCTPVGLATSVYQLTFTSSGVPQFSKIGQTNEISAGRVGVGIPTVTSFNNRIGTAILWMTDPDAGLRAWYAVPQNGVLQKIKIPQIGGANKFQRPAFGDGRVYTTDSNGVLYCLGAPVNLPLNCTSPIDFGAVALGNKSVQNVSCTAIIAITSINGATVGNGYFSVNNSTLPTGPLNAGATFIFPVTWDLTNVQVGATANTSFGNVSPGIKSTPLTILTTNAVAGYATLYPISLTGTEVSSKPFLAIAPTTVDYGGIIITNTSNINPQSAIFTISNKGLVAMTITGYAYTADELDDNPVFINSTVINGAWDLGFGYFTAVGLPAIGSQVAPSSQISIQSSFDPTNGTGSYNSYWQVWSDGGSVNIILEGIASTAPITNFSISNGEGGWLPQANLLMDFGKVAPGSSSSQQIRICNVGGSSLEISKSKPPNGVFHISDPTELHESQQVAVNDCAYGTVIFSANVEEYNKPDLLLNNTWTLNTDDVNWGVHVVEISGTVISKKVGPINSTTGQTIYNYLGCFQESTTGPRLFPNQGYTPNTTANDNNMCQEACYGLAQYSFAGTEYTSQCWCGNTPPPLAAQDVTDALCNFACPGDSNDACGGTGYISVFYNPTEYVAGSDPSLYGPKTVSSVGNYNYLGCYSEGTAGRALAGLSPQAPPTGFTIELCAAGCQGFTYFGMEYANECYCGNLIGVGSVNQSSGTPSINGCSMLCKGNAKEYCGGPGRLDVYMLNTASSSTTSSTSTAQTTSTSTSPSSFSTLSTPSTPSSTSSTSAIPTPTGPITVTNVPGYDYLGCYSEATTGRALSGLQPAPPVGGFTIESCQKICSGFEYFGMEYSNECYCGATINAGSVLQAGIIPTINGCDMLCAGNASEYCGGGSRLNMYQLNGTTSTPPTGPITVTNLTGWNYLGCYNESTTGRALSGLENPIPGANNSVEACSTACAAWTYFGVEYVNVIAATRSIQARHCKLAQRRVPQDVV
ncbi:86c7ab1a-b181-4c17-907e-67653ddef4d4 [Sclerotinia trifoliorum]|uniref:86c7ab1a-b181-4c17-907e-67653ddef4d4 n=1 Tax=Sclerotinia trifoliorum TaxID=28548 RepID=A0A8H2VX42_9HELO|nr:86c7ab1a-b181-4c17-907e-67653ddef4d4 [Sclerotinia trifoliorum]